MRYWLGLLAVFYTSFVAAAPEYFLIDEFHTYPHFAIDHMGFSTLYGRFDQTNGKIIIDRANNNGYIDISISAVSVNTGNEKRDEHLRSADFLNISENPKIIYKSTNISFVGNDRAKVEGNLTLMGVTKPVSLDVQRIHCGNNPVTNQYTCGFEATASIKRSDFGSTFDYPNVGDNMKLWFDVEAIRDNAATGVLR